MADITKEEEEHLTSLITTRPGYRIIVISPRMYDEDQKTREHKYPRAHPYITGMKYVLDYMRLADFDHPRVLDIGSPLQQNVALACTSWCDLTVLDVRSHPDTETLGLKWEKGTAIALPFPAHSWDMVTSLWVMGHVGDGRYGDALDPDGDRKMLNEIARVLVPGGICILGVGLVDEKDSDIFNLHRIYSWPWLRFEFERTGFDVLEEVNLPVEVESYVNHETLTIERRDGFYALALLRKR